MDEEEVYVSYVYGNYIDEVLSMRKDIDGAGTTHDVEEYYFHEDDLFNVVLVTDESGGAVERYEYGDYGAPFYYDGSGDWIPYPILNNTRLFNGREWDQETRFYYYRTRYLEPTMGRFTTRDSIGVWGDAANVGNGVGYTHSNPWRMLDADGRQATSCPPPPPNRRKVCFAACISGTKSPGGACYWPCRTCDTFVDPVTVIGCLAGCMYVWIPGVPSWLQVPYRKCVAGCFAGAGLTIAISCPMCAGCVLSQAYICANACGY